MKTIQLFCLGLALSGISLTATAQSATESFKVAGNCGMCKTRIEKAAKAAGAETAEWDKDSKELKVKFSSSTSLAKIQQKVAEVGHDNDAFKSTDEVYSKLPGCCKYERTAPAKEENLASCAKEGENGASCCSKDGKEGKGGKDASCGSKDHGKEGKSAGCGGEAKDGKSGGSCCSKKN